MFDPCFIRGCLLFHSWFTADRLLFRAGDHLEGVAGCLAEGLLVLFILGGSLGLGLDFAQDRDVRVVVLTGADEEPQAAQALQEGAQEYLIKDEIESRDLLRSRHSGLARSIGLRRAWPRIS